LGGASLTEKAAAMAEPSTYSPSDQLASLSVTSRESIDGGQT